MPGRARCASRLDCDEGGKIKVVNGLEKVKISGCVTSLPGDHDFPRYGHIDKRAHALSGDMIAAENDYQHAEHYFKSLSPDREGL
jgi:hypothetical protein